MLLEYEQLKNQAWDRLTAEEKQRVIAITPEAVKQLGAAKRKGLIRDGREVKDGVYEIYLIGEAIPQYTVTVDSVSDRLAQIESELIQRQAAAEKKARSKS